MSDYLTDAKRAEMLNMSLDEFQKLVGFDPLQKNPQFLGASCPYCQDSEEDEADEMDDEGAADKAEDVQEVSDKLKSDPQSKIN